MGRDFYGEVREEVIKRGEPLVPEFIKNNSEIKNSTLPNGNSVLEPVVVTGWVNKLRRNVIDKKEYVEAEIETQKSAARNELETIKQYWSQNVFADKKELDSQVVTAGVFALGAWCFGSVLSCKNNWGFQSLWNSDQAGVLKRTPTAFSRILTSLPVRMTLPWIAAGVTFSKLAPNTWNNALQTLKRDVLPKDVVEQSSALYDDLIERGFKVHAKSLNQSAHENLQATICSIRETIAENIK
ncbi:unnamed protein product [Kluyveromyces dobzhanskii CBS 2104]|uniref:WGS project CCBQ000000000 data, contig 00015 n=1 Tax=Kluyveromyces dobzhanskii CBS 2104 TaxID=1427455 RepID=A0A0A8LBE2_9SACH|nr:unnamed protein product [Kluyveromyces dobzhanskii CBS 2104]